MAVRAETDITLTRVDDGAAGSNGATFTPSVDVDGDISWTNDGGLPNPPTQNIMGPAGSSGLSVTGVKTQYYLSMSDSSPTGGSWSDTPQAFVSGNYYWTRDYIDYSDGTHDTSTPVYNRGLTYACEYAESASDAADEASGYATNAFNTANMALEQLGIVEDIVGVLDLVANNGTYARTTDETAQPDKWYFTYTGTAYEVAVSPTFEYVLTQDSTIVAGKPYYTRSGSGTEQDPYVYTPVETPVQADIGTYYEYTNWYYYELTGIDQTIQNYVSSHLVLAGNSLFLQTNDGEGSTRLELNTTDGLTLYDQNGSPVAKYGTNTIIGNEAGFHVKIDGTEIGFYQAEQKVAYINGNKLYITQSVVLQQMDVGTPANEGGLGQWSWKVHEVDGQNNLYLKWLG